MTLKKISPLLFDLFVVALLGGAVYSAWQWPFATGLFPLTIGIPALAVAVGQLAADLRGLLGGGGPEPTARPEEHIIDIRVDHDLPPRVVARRAGAFFGSMIGFFILVLLIGLKISLPVFLFGYLKFASRASWPLTLILVALIVTLVLGFDQLLNVPWHEGLLQEKLGIDL